MRTKIKVLNLFVCMFVITAAFSVAIPDNTDLDSSLRGNGNKNVSPRSPIVLPPLDSVPPEAVIHFDVDTREIDVYGVDNVDENVLVVETIISDKKHKKTILYTLTDDAGNTLDLLLEYKSRDGNKEARVLKMSYNGGRPIVTGENHFKVEFKTEKRTSELIHLHQNIHVIDKFKIETNYKSEGEETSIKYKGKESCKAKFEVEGLALIDLMTDNSELIISRLTDRFENYYAIDELMDFYDYIEECKGADVVLVDPLQLITYVSLENASADPVEIRFGDVFGVPELIAGRWATDPTITEPEDKAIDFVETYGDIFRLNSTMDSFTVSSAKTGHLYIKNVRLQQTYLGVPVYGAEQLVHLDLSGNILFIHGTFVPEINVSTTPRITMTEAFDIAHEDLKNKFTSVQNVSILEYELRVYNPAVGNEFETDADYLVWFLSIQTGNPDGLWHYFVDAQSGEIVEFENTLRLAYSSEVWEDKGAVGDILWYRDGMPVGGIVGPPPPDAMKANDYIGIYYDYLFNTFGHDSIDGAGLTLRAYTYSDAWDIRNNAGWRGSKAEFYDDWVTRDTVAHEFTHGLVSKSAGGLKRTLDEHIADSFAEFLECHTRCNWEVGRDVEGDTTPSGVLRNMSNPPEKGHADHIDDYDYEDTLGDFYSNAGILNKVVYLITEGGVHYGVSVRGLGLHKAEQLVFSTLIDIGLTSSATFRQYHDVMLQTCRAMIGGAVGITSSDCREVADAWRSVGIYYLTQNMAGRTNTDFDMFGYTLAAGDFNGDKKDDLAVGVPYENYWGRTNNGVVIVFYGSHLGLTAKGAELLTQRLADIEEEDFDKFGSSLAVGDFDGDEYDDLAVGVPHKDIGEDTRTGQVVVFYGGITGLITDLVVMGAPVIKCEVLHQEKAGQFNEDYDNFGFSLAAGNFDGDGYDDLAVGVPFEDEDFGWARDMGMVIVYYGRYDGLIKDIIPVGQLPVKREVLDQEYAGEENERDDAFGHSLAAGDFNGDDCDDLAVGVPYEDIKPITSTGMVNVFYGDERGLIDAGSATAELLDQSMVGEENENNDRFGFSLAVGDFDFDGYHDLAIGTPGEDNELAKVVINDVGMVAVIYGANDGLIRDGVAKLRTKYERLDEKVYALQGRSNFGYSLTAGKFANEDYDGLAVGMPWADIYRPEHIENTGMVVIFYGSTSGLIKASSANYRNLSQEEIGGINENDDLFGFALAAGDFDNPYLGLHREDHELVVGTPMEDFPGGILDAGVVYIWDAA